MLQPLALPEVAPVLQGERVLLRPPRSSDIDDRLSYPIDPEEEDAYGGSWRRHWHGQRVHTREHLASQMAAAIPPGHLVWCVEYQGRAIGSSSLGVDARNHRATYAVGTFASELRRLGLGREITRVVADWGFRKLGLHRIELEVLTTNLRAIRCYEAVGFRREGIRREAELYPRRLEGLSVHGPLAAEWTAQVGVTSPLTAA
jgi:RimJ/RimL family protein N-acetyltransferase